LRPSSVNNVAFSFNLNLRLLTGSAKFDSKVILVFQIGDEFHYIMRCSYFHDKRESCIEKQYLTRINVLKFKEIISSKTQSKLRKRRDKRTLTCNIIYILVLLKKI
jgi:hypothetical protein